MSYLRHTSDDRGNIVTSNYDSDGNWVGKGPDPKTEMVFWMHVRRTPVIEEIVALASKHSGVKVEYRRDPQHHGDLDLSNPNRDQLWTLRDGRYKGGFTDEFNRLSKLITSPLDEPILPEDSLIYGGYWYVVDGNPRECEIFTSDGNEGIRVSDFKRRTGAQEVRRCDMMGRERRAPAQPERNSFERNFNTQLRDDPAVSGTLGRLRERYVGMPGHWDSSGRSIKQYRRKPRNSNKIKKVK